MPRIRSIKPEFWDSPSTARASLHARLLYIAMWNWADDWGIGDANPRRLLGFAFPSDGDSAVEPRNFRHLAAEVAEAFGVKWYEVDGREFYEVQNWEQHQRTEKRATRRNPPSDQAERWLYTETAESPRLNRGSSEDGTGEQGNRGTGEQGNSSELANARSLEPAAKPRKRKRPERPRPDDWTPTAAHAAIAAEEGVDLHEQAARFKDHHDSRGQQFVDWDAAFRNWLRRAADYAPRPNLRAVPGAQPDDLFARARQRMGITEGPEPA